MRSNATLTIPRANRFHWRRLATIFAGVALAIALGVTIAFALANRAGDEPTVVAPGTSAVPDFAIEFDAGVTAAQFEGADAFASPAASGEERLIIYVVGSEDQARVLREELAWILALRLDDGMPASVTDVIVADSPERQAAVIAQLTELVNIRAVSSAGPTEIYYPR